MAHIVKCVKLGREAEGLEEPPFDSPLGQKIYENVSKEAWEQWSEHMKMLLNEYRLQPWRKEHQEFIAQQMDAYFFGEGSARPAEYVPPERKTAT
jgi:Fe-S cluster biosynthesis and repair protein YggX